MKKFIIINSIAIIGLLFLCSCEQDVSPLEKGNVNAARKVLIAGTATAFKQSVILKVMEKLGTADYYFKVIGLNQLAGEETGRFGAILLVNAMMAGRLDGRVKQFLAKSAADPKVIVFYTRGTDDPMPSWFKLDPDVDSVTSASKSERADEWAEQLVKLIEKRFQPD
jgi:hypothetical protein